MSAIGNHRTAHAANACAEAKRGCIALPTQAHTRRAIPRSQLQNPPSVPRIRHPQEWQRTQSDVPFPEILMDEQVEAAPGVNVPAVKIYRWGAVMTWLPFGFFGALYIAGQLGFKPSWTAILYTAGLSPCIAIMGFFIQLVGFVAGRPWRVQKYPFLFFFSIVSLPVWVAILLNY